MSDKTWPKFEFLLNFPRSQINNLSLTFHSDSYIMHIEPLNPSFFLLNWFIKSWTIITPKKLNKQNKKRIDQFIEIIIIEIKKKLKRKNLYFIISESVYQTTKMNFFLHYIVSWWEEFILINLIIHWLWLNIFNKKNA